VGAVDAAATAARLEGALLAGAAAGALPAFVAALEAALHVIEARVGPGAPGQAPLPPDPVAFAAALGRLTRILHDHELVPDALLGEVCGLAAALGAERLAESLRGEVESFDYERALQTAEALGFAQQAGEPGGPHER
jgi:hypothetical protein